MQGRTREQFINSIIPGNIIAFKIKDGMFSGKVLDIQDGTYTVETTNGSIHYINQENIVWVKNGSKYPEGIYNALKYTKR